MANTNTNIIVGDSNNLSAVINTDTDIVSKLPKFYFSENELIPGLPNDMALECFLRVPFTSHPTLRLVSNDWKTTISHPFFFSLRRRSAFVEHLVFLIQAVSPAATPELNRDVREPGLKEDENCNKSGPLLYNLSIYNSSHQEWRKISNITIPTFAQCVALPKVGKVIVLGGWDPATLVPVPKVLVIDLARGTWREGSPMPTARSFFACAAVGSTVYVAGGHDGQKNALKTAEVYDVEADQWRKLPDMAEERDESHGLLLGDDGTKFWVVSGYGTESQGRFRSDAEVYDPETNTWTQIESMWPFPGHTPKSTAVAAARWTCIIGGEAKEFDFSSKSWKALNMGLIPKSVIGSTSISMVDMGDDKIMVMGNGERKGDECKEEGCGGEGVFMVEKTSQGANNGVVNWNWRHVHAPLSYLGFPFSSSNLFI